MRVLLQFDTIEIMSAKATMVTTLPGGGGETARAAWGVLQRQLWQVGARGEAVASAEGEAEKLLERSFDDISTEKDSMY